MAWTLCTSGQALAKAGLNANVSGSATADWSEQSEGWFNSETRRDWITNPPSAALSGAVADVVSLKIGNKIIKADMSGYTSRLEAGTMVDINDDSIRKGIAVLKQDENQDINK